MISPAGGEATELTHFDGGVTAFEWSPDGNRIAFTSTGAEPKAKKDRKEKYGDFEIVEGDYTMVQLWTLNADEESPKAEALTTGYAIQRRRIQLVARFEKHRVQRHSRSGSVERRHLRHLSWFACPISM